MLQHLNNTHTCSLTYRNSDRSTWISWFFFRYQHKRLHNGTKPLGYMLIASACHYCKGLHIGAKLLFSTSESAGITFIASTVVERMWTTELKIRRQRVKIHIYLSQKVRGVQIALVRKLQCSGVDQTVQCDSTGWHVSSAAGNKKVSKNSTTFKGWIWGTEKSSWCANFHETLGLACAHLYIILKKA